MCLAPYIDENTPKINEKKEVIPTITQDEWALYTEAVNVLKLPYDTTIRMQREDYTPADFYADWLNLKLQLQKLTCKLATDLLTALEQRQEKLLKSPVVLSSVFLDPRYRSLLSSEDASIAIQHLTHLKNRLEGSQEVNDEEPLTQTNGRYSDLAALVNEKTRNNPFFKPLSAGSDFLRPIFSIPTEKDFDRSPIEFWAAYKHTHPLLYQVTCIVNAASPTQTSVERAFSTLSFILNSRRTSLSEKMLQAILYVRMNAELWVPLNLE